MAETALPRAAALRWRGAAVAVGAGVLAGLGQVPFALWPVALAGLALACWTGERAPSVRRAAWTGWLVGTGYFATTLHWIVEPFLVDIVRQGWMAPFALLFCATGFALFWGAAFGAARALAPRGGWRFALAWAAALALAEFLRSTILTGFPWALIGYVWTETPAAQLAALTGSFGLTLLTLMGAGAVAVSRRWSLRAATFVAVAVALLGGGWLLTPPPDAPRADAPLIRLVQPNAPQHEKWVPERAAVFWERQLQFTADAAAARRPDLIVWPETAIPWRLPGADDALARIAAHAGGVPVALGVERTEGGRYYNSLAVVGPDGAVTDIYDKHHLVPFGEFTPFGGLPRLIGLRGYDAQDGYGFTPGPGARLLDFGPLGRALPLICYEAIFARDVAASPARPDWLLQITNDAWFGTFSGPYMHLAQARMRTIEQGLPMVRAANTGISAVIDSAGRVGDSLPLGQAGFLDVNLPPARPPTFYARTGDWPWLAAMGLILAGLAALRLRRAH